jgi:FAD/FMN-containing dehydrogenase
MFKKIQTIVGADHVTDNRDLCEVATSDVFERNEHAPALMVVSPGTTEETSAVLQILFEKRIPVLGRGAGLSYTASFAGEHPAVVVDTGRLNAINVNAEDRYAVVGAGASWADVRSALQSFNMKSAQPSPISGAFATVGGLASQGIPAGLEGILGTTVVLSDGSVVRTGASARFYRFTGPDLTGLFLGDCGAFGIKTEIVLRIVPEQPTLFASFGYDDVNHLLENLIVAIREGVVSRAFAVDKVRSTNATKVGLSEAIGTATEMVRRSASLQESAKTAAMLLRQAIAPPESKPWSLHLTIESPTTAGAQSQLRRVCDICQTLGKRGDDMFPRALHAKPYSVRGFVGPEGERWVPVHGIFSLSRASSAMNDLQEFIASRAVPMHEHGVTASWLLSSAGPYVLIEPMLYWRDQLDPLHMRYLSPRNQKRFGNFKPNLAARSFVGRIREGLRDVMDRHEASHSQIGRFYRLEASEQRDSLLWRLKMAVDPKNQINPGVLGLSIPAPDPLESPTTTRGRS